MRNQRFAFLPLAGKAILLGGAGGLGSVIAHGLADAGARLVVADMNEEAAQSVAQAVRRRKGDCIACRMNILNPAEIGEAMKMVQKCFGRMDVALNGIGINIRKPSLEVKEKDWDRVLDVNLKGAFFFAQCAARTFLGQRPQGGKIITIASLLTFFGMEDRTAYSASKTGILGMTRCLAVEWGKYGIRVNGIAPTFIPTAINRETLKGAFKERLVGRTPLGRLGKPQDIVGTIIFLASDASDFITGQIIPIDGGWLAG